MLEPPDLPAELLIARLRDGFGLDVAAVRFLPLGADPRTAVFRAEARGGAAFFVKLRRGGFDEVAVTLPAWLRAQGLDQVIPPLPARDGRLWADLAPFTVIVYPFIEGVDGSQRALSAGQWRAFGAALRFLHEARPPPDILGRIPTERYDDVYRRELRAFLSEIDDHLPADQTAADLVAFLQEQRATTLALLERAEQLAEELRARPPELVVCHADAHAWNLLIAAERLYLVDWDTLIRAPRERDLMFIGAGLGFRGVTPEQEQALFYAGYGPTEVDRAALAYYRYERVIEDLAIYCGDILLYRAADADRAQGLVYLKSNYRPGGTIDRAREAER